MIRNNPLYKLYITILLYLAGFYETKKKWRKELMFIEQYIAFELKGPGPPGRTCNPKTGYFYDKTKIPKANLQVNYYLLLKILQKAM